MQIYFPAEYTNTRVRWLPLKMKVAYLLLFLSLMNLRVVAARLPILAKLYAILKSECVNMGISHLTGKPIHSIYHPSAVLDH